MILIDYHKNKNSAHYYIGNNIYEHRHGSSGMIIIYVTKKDVYNIILNSHKYILKSSLPNILYIDINDPYYGICNFYNLNEFLKTFYSNICFNVEYYVVTNNEKTNFMKLWTSLVYTLNPSKIYSPNHGANCLY